MKFVLVNAPPYRIREAFYDRPPYPRVGLAFLAAALRAAGLDVSILDAKYTRLSHEQATDAICRECPDCIGYTALTNEIIPAGRLASAVKARLPQAISIIGGVHASILPERTLREFAAFDYACVGEGEVTIVEFAQELTALRLEKAHVETRLPLGVPGLAYLDTNGAFVCNSERQRVADLDSIPMPAWDLFQPASEYIIHTQRGCPYHCPFCVNPNGRHVRMETPGRVLAQLTLLHEKFGCKRIMFGNEIFTLNKGYVEQLCHGIMEQKLHKKLRWWCATHINFMDEHLARLMREAGCYRVGLGLESGDPERLRMIGKGTTIERILTVTTAMQKAKLPFESYFILGQPNETAESARKTVDFAVRVNADFPVFGIMVPYPGTAIGQMAEEGHNGYRLSARDWNDYNKQLGDALDFTGVPRKTLEKIQMIGYLKVFLWNGRFLDLIRFVWRYRLVGWNWLKHHFQRRAVP